MDFSFITDEALRAKATKAFEDAIAEATSGLQAKNNELLGKLKKAQKSGEIDPADYQSLQDENERLKTENGENKKTIKKLSTDFDATKKQYESESQFASRLLIDNGLNDALIKAGVKPEMTKAVKALIAPQVKIKTEGDNRTPVIGEKSLSDFVTEWASSDEGKHFVAAPLNQGGGANGGGNGKGNVKQMTRAAFDAQDPVQKSEFIKAGGVVIN
jgi:hypothetical protein